MSLVKFIQGTQDKIESSEIQEGTIYFATDLGAVAYDLNGKRTWVASDKKDSFDVLPVTEGGTGSTSSLTKEEIDEIWGEVLGLPEEGSTAVLPVINGGTGVSSLDALKVLLGIDNVSLSWVQF